MRVVVIGAGEVGYSIALRLVKEKADVVLVDINSERLETVSEVLDVQTIAGYGSNPDTLIEAGIKDADMLVAVTGHDETNILACRMAQLLAPSDTRRLARIKASGYYDLFDEKQFRSDFGINFIINPSQEAVETIMDFINFPGTSDVIPIARGRLRLVGMRLNMQHRLLGKPLAELVPRDQETPDILVAAIYRRHELIIPRGDTVLKMGDLIYVVAKASDTAKVNQFYDLDPQPIKNITIVGGGDVGYFLAKHLEQPEKKYNIKLIETNPARCQYLSKRLNHAMVIKGDGTDQSLLLEENISDTDAFIAVSTDDEKNMISCLLAKRLGANHTITRVNRFSYAPLVSAIGLESLVSVRVAAVSAILKYLRQGRVISVATLANEDAEIIETQVLRDSEAADKKIMDLSIPRGALVIALSRGEEEVIIPQGNTIIKKGDILAVLARSDTTREVAKYLSGN